MSAPDLTKKVLAFRAWNISQGRLTATGVNTFWPAGPQTARCVKSDYYSTDEPCEHAPGAKCDCGIYALHAPDSRWWAANTSKWTCGATLSWGRMEVHHGGIRAEFAEPVLLAWDELRGPKHVKHVLKVAEYYCVPTCPLDELEQRAKEFGAVMPEDMRPEKEAPQPRTAGMHVTGFSNLLKEMWTRPLYGDFVEAGARADPLVVRPGEVFEEIAARGQLYYDFDAGEMRAA